MLKLFVVDYFCVRCLAVSPNFEIAKNNMAIALTDLGTKVISCPVSAIEFIFL